MIKYFKITVLFFIFYASNVSEAKACHAVALVNPTLTEVPGGVEFNASSSSVTCGCTNIYWIDIEMRFSCEAFDPGPLNPGHYGPEFSYPHYQSAQMNKPGCQQIPYPTTFVSYDDLCPGVEYKVRYQENHNGDWGGWSQDFTFTVPGDPIPLTGDIFASTEAICIGDPVDLEFDHIDGCTDGLDYLWEVCPDDNGAPSGNWTTVGNMQNETVYPTEDSWYRVTAEGPCQIDFLQLEIFINVAPLPDLTITEPTICKGEVVDLISNVDLTGGDYIWNNDPTLNNPDLTGLSPDTNTIYYLDYVLDDCTVSVQTEITVGGVPIADFDFDNICFGTSAEFNDLTSVENIIGDFIDEWEWDFGDGNTSNQQSPTHDYSDEGVYSVSLNVTSNQGCSDSVESDLSVYPMPEVGFSYFDVCLETPSQFNDQSTVSNAHTSNSVVEWTWDFDDGNISNDQNPEHIFDTEGDYDIELTAVTNNGCSVSQIQSVTVHPLPTAVFNTEPIAGCAPLCYDLISTSTVSGGTQNIVEYRWNYSNGNTFISTDDSIHSNCLQNNTVNPIALGVELEVVSDKGCINSIDAPNLLEVYHNPIADFDYFGTNENKKPDIFHTEVEFINESRYAAFYEWDVEDVGLFEEEDFTYDFGEEPRTYRVDLMAITENGCKDSVYQIIDIQDVVLFYVPNAFTPDFDAHNQKWKPVFTSGIDFMDFKLLVFNRWGEVVWESNDASVGWDGSYGTESNKLVKEGTYIWKLEFKETMTDKRHIHTGHVTLIR